MSKLLKCKIDVTKVDRTKLFEGEKGTYLDIDVWINDEPDKYGNHASIQQHTKKDEEKNYIGSGKFWVAKEGNSDTSWIGKTDKDKPEATPEDVEADIRAGKFESSVPASQIHPANEDDLPF
jgi:hypothetical protein